MQIHIVGKNLLINKCRAFLFNNLKAIFSLNAGKIKYYGNNFSKKKIMYARKSVIHHKFILWKAYKILAYL